MGTTYIVACHKCEEYVDLDKMPQSAYGALNHKEFWPEAEQTIKDGRGHRVIYKAFHGLQLTAFVKKHSGHELHFYADFNEPMYMRIVGFSVWDGEVELPPLSYKEFGKEDVA